MVVFPFFPPGLKFSSFLSAGFFNTHAKKNIIERGLDPPIIKKRIIKKIYSKEEIVKKTFYVEKIISWPNLFVNLNRRLLKFLSWELPSELWSYRTGSLQEGRMSLLSRPLRPPSDYSLTHSQSHLWRRRRVSAGKFTQFPLFFRWEALHHTSSEQLFSALILSGHFIY